jgi:hypothetical protein
MMEPPYVRGWWCLRSLRLLAVWYAWISIRVMVSSSLSTDFQGLLAFVRCLHN